MDRMCKHPVVAESEVFRHFLTCTDEKVCVVTNRQSGAVWFIPAQAELSTIADCCQVVVMLTQTGYSK